MELGAFSVSLTVRDLVASQSFYEQLGFRVFHGDPGQHWVIMRNGTCVIGLFQGMFERNILTFNPGWDQAAQPTPSYSDIRDLQRELKARGMNFVQEADPAGHGPASFLLIDPDGNPVLFDQHR